MEWPDLFGDQLRWSALASRKLRRYLGRRLSFQKRTRIRQKRSHFPRGFRIEDIEDDETAEIMPGGRRSKKFTRAERGQLHEDEIYNYYRGQEPEDNYGQGEIMGTRGQLQAGGSPPPETQVSHAQTFMVTTGSTTGAALATGTPVPFNTAVAAPVRIPFSNQINPDLLMEGGQNIVKNPFYQPQRPQIQPPVPGEDDSIDWDKYRNPPGIHGPDQAPSRVMPGGPDFSDVPAYQPYGQSVRPSDDAASLGGVSMNTIDPFSDVESMKSADMKNRGRRSKGEMKAFPPVTRRRESHSGPRKGSPYKDAGRRRTSRGPRTPPERPERSRSRRTPSPPKPSSGKKSVFGGDPPGLVKKREDEKRKAEAKARSANRASQTNQYLDAQYAKSTRRTSSTSTRRRTPSPAPTSSRTVYVNPNHPTFVKKVKAVNYHGSAVKAMRKLRGPTPNPEEDPNLRRTVRGDSLEPDAPSLFTERKPPEP